MRFSLPSIKCSAAQSQPPNTAERAVINSLSTVQSTKQSSVVVRSWEEAPKHLIDGSKKRICWLSFEWWNGKWGMGNGKLKMGN